MLRLSTKSRYGLRAIFDIAYYSKDKPAQVKDISRRQEIPPRYLEQIFRNLTKAKIVGSKRGPRGGYFLLKKSGDITVKDIIDATEGDIEMSPCNQSESELLRCQRYNHCAAQIVWSEAQDILSNFLESITILDLCSKAEILGIEKEKDVEIGLSV